MREDALLEIERTVLSIKNQIKLANLEFNKFFFHGSKRL